MIAQEQQQHILCPATLQKQRYALLERCCSDNGTPEEGARRIVELELAPLWYNKYFAAWEYWKSSRQKYFWNSVWSVRDGTTGDTKNTGDHGDRCLVVGIAAIAMADLERGTPCTAKCLPRYLVKLGHNNTFWRCRVASRNSLEIVHQCAPDAYRWFQEYGIDILEDMGFGNYGDKVEQIVERVQTQFPWTPIRGEDNA